VWDGWSLGVGSNIILRYSTIHEVTTMEATKHRVFIDNYSSLSCTYARHAKSLLVLLDDGIRPPSGQLEQQQQRRLTERLWRATLTTSAVLLTLWPTANFRLGRHPKTCKEGRERLQLVLWFGRESRHSLYYWRWWRWCHVASWPGPEAGSMTLLPEMPLPIEAAVVASL